jgi:hypothetical protein
MMSTQTKITPVIDIEETKYLLGTDLIRYEQLSPRTYRREVDKLQDVSLEQNMKEGIQTVKYPLKVAFIEPNMNMDNIKTAFFIVLDGIRRWSQWKPKSPTDTWYCHIYSYGEWLLGHDYSSRN